MLWFVLQMVPLLLGALAIGLLVGWLVWARTLRKTRSMHHTDTSVLRTQIASLGDESRRLQQRFAGVAQDLDGARVDHQMQLQELTTTREAFRVSQSNLAAAEADLVEQRVLVEQEAEKQLEQRQQLADRSVRISALEVQHATSERNLSMVRQEIETTRVQLGASEQDRSALEADLERLTSEVDVANGEFRQAASEAERANVEHRLQLERVRFDLEAATRQISSLTLAAGATQTAALRDRHLSDERSIEAERVAADAVRQAESDFRQQLQRSQHEALEAQTELRAEHQNQAAIQNAVAARIADQLRRALDAATIRANEAEARVGRLRAEFGTAQASTKNETTSLRSSLADSSSEVALLRNEVAASLSANVAGKQELRRDAQAALDVARRQWMATQDRLHNAERQLAKKDRQLADLCDVQLSQRQGLTSGLHFFDVQNGVLRGETITSDSAHRREVQRLETTQRERELAHQLAIQHWRRDLHHRFDDIEERKTELVHRDARILELEATLLASKIDADAQLLVAEQRTEALVIEHRMSTADLVDQSNKFSALSQHVVEATAVAEQRVLDLQTEVLNLQTEVLNLQTEALDVQSELERVSYERHLLEEERDRLRSTADLFETARNGFADDIAVMTIELAALTNQLSVTQSEAFEQQKVVKATIDVLENDLAQLTAERIKLIAVVEQTEARHAASETANLATLVEVASQQQRIGEIERQLDLSSEDVLSFTEQLAEQTATAATLRSALAVAEAEHVEQAGHLISEYDAHVAVLEAQLEAERIEVNRLATVAEDAARIQVLFESELVSLKDLLLLERDEKVAAKGQLQVSTVELSSAAERCQTLENELRAAAVHVQTAIEERQSAQRDVAATVGLTEALRVELAEASNGLLAAQAEVAVVRSDGHELAEQLVVVRSELETAEADLLAIRYSSAQSEMLLITNQAQFETSELDLTAARALIDEAVVDRNLLNTQLAEAGERCSDLEHECERARQEVQRTQSDVARLIAEVDRLSAERDRIQEAQDQLNADLAAESHRSADREDEISRQRNALFALEAARLVDLRFNEVREADRVVRQVVRSSQVLTLESAGRDARSEADAWRRELVELRKRFDALVARPTQRFPLLDPNAIAGRTASQDAVAARRVRGSSQTRLSEVETESSVQANPGLVDNLQRIEGIGPKIAAALKGAGISTFVRLEAATIEQLRDALASAGLTFAPSLQTWSKQSGFLVRGDEEGFRSLTNVLVAGRDDRKTEAP
jgi:predicted flap endonuclease-1-like 5' DNA nuclease